MYPKLAVAMSTGFLVVSIVSRFIMSLPRYMHLLSLLYPLGNHLERMRKLA